MKISTQKKWLLFVAVFTIYEKVFAQSLLTQNEKNTDSIAQLVIVYFNNNEPDNIYNLLNDDFKKKLPYSKFRTISQSQIFPLTPFYNIAFKQTKDGVNKYKAESK